MSSLFVVLCLMSWLLFCTSEIKYACENKELEINCENKGVIHINNATYGRTKGFKDCKTLSSMVVTTLFDKSCGSRNSLVIVHNACHLKRKCVVNVTDKIFGDPCPARTEYLEVNYHCMEGSTVSVYLDNSTNGNIDSISTFHVSTNTSNWTSSKNKRNRGRNRKTKDELIIIIIIEVILIIIVSTVTFYMWKKRKAGDSRRTGCTSIYRKLTQRLSTSSPSEVNTDEINNDDLYCEIKLDNTSYEVIEMKPSSDDIRGVAPSARS